MANEEYDKYKDKYEKKNFGNKIWNGLKIWEKVIVAKHNEEIINDASEYAEKCRRLNAPLLEDKHIRELDKIRKLVIQLALSENQHDKPRALKELIYGYNASLYDDNVRAGKGVDGIGRTPALIRNEDLGLKTLEGSSEYHPIEEDFDDTLNRLMLETDTAMCDPEYAKNELIRQYAENELAISSNKASILGNSGLNKEVSINKSVDEIKSRANANKAHDEEVKRRRLEEIRGRKKIEIIEDDLEKGGDI